jgi:hypothetical protein
MRLGTLARFPYNITTLIFERDGKYVMAASSNIAVAVPGPRAALPMIVAPRDHAIALGRFRGTIREMVDLAYVAAE